MEEYFMIIAVFVSVFIAILGVCTIIYLIFCNQPASNSTVDKKKFVSLLAVIGSGGHTKELLSLVEHLDSKYQPRYYIMANTDKMSEEKVHTLESTQQNEYKVYKIPRSREVKQSWITTVLSTVYAFIYSFPIVFKLKPDIILCNGPGTCIPVCLAGIFLKMFHRVRIIYVESICRVETLSLSGKIAYRVADCVVVQWQSLKTKYQDAIYFGRVV